MASEQQHNAQAMFNLGYMHELGLGMKKDWHLAKRFYDLASETSVDAKVPVALALLKLSVMFKLESMKEVKQIIFMKLAFCDLYNVLDLLQSPLRFLFELDKNIASNWDLYLITILTILLGTIFYFRRPAVQNVERDHNRSQETSLHTSSSISQSTTTPPSPTSTETENTVHSDQ